MRGWSIWGCIVATAMSIGLFINPIAMASGVKPFGIKPVIYGGCNFKEAVGVSFFFAIFAVLCSILLLLASWLLPEKAIGTLFGIMGFWGALSTITSTAYQESTLSTLNSLRSGTIQPTFSFGAGEWSYSREDWGVFYDNCSNESLTPSEFVDCFRSDLVDEINDYELTQQFWGKIGIGISCCCALFVINRKPLATLTAAAILALFTSLWALPINSTALYLRAPDKYELREYCATDYRYKCIIGFAWAIPFAFILLFVMAYRDSVYGVMGCVGVLVACAVGIVAIITIFRKGECGKLAEKPLNSLYVTAFPHYIFVGILTIYVIGSIISGLCGQPEGGVIVVRYIIIYVEYR